MDLRITRSSPEKSYRYIISETTHAAPVCIGHMPPVIANCSFYNQGLRETSENEFTKMGVTAQGTCICDPAFAPVARFEQFAQFISKPKQTYCVAFDKRVFC